MKYLNLIWIFGLLLFGGCVLSDPVPDNIPPSYVWDELPVVSIDTVIVETDQSVSVAYSIEGENTESFHTLKLCLSNLNQVPDSTEAIVDLLPYYKAGVFKVKVQNLLRNKDYYASLYIGNRTKKAYSTVKQFLIKSVVSNERWEYVTSIPALTKRVFKHVFVVKEKAYFISHFIEWLDYGGREMWEYEPVLDCWTRKADFPGIIRKNPCVLSIGDKGYMGLGNEMIEPGSYKSLSDWWMYDPAKDQWIERASISSTEYDITAAFVIDRIGYVMKSHGYSSLYPTNVYAYNPQTNKWIKKSVFSGQKLVGSGSFVIGDRAFIVGGEYWKGVSVLNTCIWEYNHLMDTWKQQGDFPGSARKDLKSFVLNDKVYMGWGLELNSNHGLQYINDCWIYDLNANLWKEEIVHPVDISADCGFSIGGKGYILSNGEIYRYDPDK